MSLYLNFRGTFTNSGLHTKSFKFLPVKLNSYQEISVCMLYVGAMAASSYLSYYADKLLKGENQSKSSFPPLLLCIGLVEKSISNAAFIIGKYQPIPCASLNCAIYFPLLGYTKYGNGSKQRKNKQIFEVRP